MTNFTMVSNEVISDKNISHGAFRLYCILNSYCYGNKDTCFPSQKTLAGRMNKCVRTIQRYLKELMRKGVIKIMRRGSTSNLYQLLNNIASNVKQRAASLFGKSSNKNHKHHNKNSKNSKISNSADEIKFSERYEGHFFTEGELEYFKQISANK